MTVENFKKAMENASLTILRQTESNLKSSGDEVRMNVVKDIIEKKEQELISKKEEPEVKPKKRGK